MSKKKAVETARKLSRPLLVNPPQELLVNTSNPGPKIASIDGHQQNLRSSYTYPKIRNVSFGRVTARD